jgi:hypothetical protein
MYGILQLQKKIRRTSTIARSRGREPERRAPTPDAAVEAFELGRFAWRG